MAKSIAPRVFKAGNVLAADSKLTGEEPNWFGWEKWSIQQFMDTRSRMLRFYGYYLSHADLKPAVIDYMKKSGWAKDDLELYKSAAPSVLPMTVGKLIRAMDRGMPSLHPEAADYFLTLPFIEDKENPPIPKSEISVVNKEISECLAFLKSQVDLKKKNESVSSSSHDEQKIVAITPMDRLKHKVEKEVIIHLEEMLDRWVTESHNAKVLGIQLVSFIRDGNISGAGCKFISDWLNKQLEEFKGAFEKTCPQLVEGYEYLSRPALRNRVSTLEAMLSDVSKYSNVATAIARKPRVKKVKDAHKQVARLQYQSTSEDYKLTSVSPAQIPTAQRVILFNTKNRHLSIYSAKGGPGLLVSGTTIKDFDTSRSFTISLRKPLDVLPLLLTNTQKQLDKTLEAIKSTRRTPNGRTNISTIILRIL